MATPCERACVALACLLEEGFPVWALLEHCGNEPEAVLSAPLSVLSRARGISSERAARFVQCRRSIDVDDQLGRLAAMGGGVVTYKHDAYPILLTNVDRPPPILYYLGDFGLLASPGVAIIGSRRPTHYGREMARHFAGELARAGYPIISGLARGIDGDAHRGALAVGGPTVAVLGSGLDRPYPPEHGDLQEAIARKGLVISEFPLGAEPRKRNFPQRNRLISGLSRGVLVVEAGRRSGTLITVEHALEQGRAVMALPGRVTSPTSAGANALIKDGAHAVTRPDEVISLMQLCCTMEPTQIAAEREEPSHPLARQFFEIMGDEPITLDAIIQQSGLGPGEIAEAVLLLMADGLIVRVAGNRYARRSAVI